MEVVPTGEQLERRSSWSQDRLKEQHGTSVLVRARGAVFRSIYAAFEVIGRVREWQSESSDAMTLPRRTAAPLQQSPRSQAC